MEAIPMEIIPLQPNSASRPVHHRLANAVPRKRDVEKRSREIIAKNVIFRGQGFSSCDF